MAQDQRRLAAIVSADVAGYSCRMVERNAGVSPERHIGRMPRNSP
jgi:hypothetical protein